eukprot:TRINITY_DN656_c0_g1_i1.p1 TRINITY_DN656_c0_g1~~TRINITY_DN656_c0_g1_i1.p1  ORF type:complete len:499 (+),score=85.34 TRINITY_DN656_c0_g1_i1:77-1498(+)
MVPATTDRQFLAQLTNEDGEATGAPFELPANVTPKQLQLLANAVLEHEHDEPQPYTFFVNQQEIIDTLSAIVAQQKLNPETVIPIVYQPQAIFRVRGISQCSATIPGHADNIVDAYFSPDGQKLATGSGDKTVRFWDVNTLTPKQTCKGHKHWVQCIAWSPDAAYVASGGRDNEVRIWDATTAQPVGKPLVGHRSYITWISWQPLHLSKTRKCTMLASSSKDGKVKIWDLVKGRAVMSLAQHTKCVTCVKWGGTDLIYTASQDTTVKVWRASDGVLCRTLSGHAHWVNSMSLSTEYVLRTGPYDERGRVDGSAVAAAKKRYDDVTRGYDEKLVSASEDNTLYLWNPVTEKKPITRMTGHQKGINYVLYSPDGRLIVSASFDKSAKLWDGKTGTFLQTFRAHVGPVYRCTWGPDSRLLITASEDSTIKLWNVKSHKLLKDLPGHEGSVFAVDWAPNGEMVASGGADKALKIWKH